MNKCVCEIEFECGAGDDQKSCDYFVEKSAVYPDSCTYKTEYDNCDCKHAKEDAWIERIG